MLIHDAPEFILLVTVGAGNLYGDAIFSRRPLPNLGSKNIMGYTGIVEYQAVGLSGEET